MCSLHLQSAIHNLKSKIHRGHSSVGRAPALQAGSQEHALDKRRVTGSSPVRPISFFAGSKLEVNERHLAGSGKQLQRQKRTRVSGNLNPRRLKGEAVNKLSAFLRDRQK